MADSLFDMLTTDMEELPALPAKIKTAGSPSEEIIDFDCEGWSNDPVPVKLEKIRATILNARSPGQLTTELAIMPVGDWLDFVIRLSPKNIQLQAEVSLVHVLAELGPIDKEQFRFKKATPVEAQC